MDNRIADTVEALKRSSFRLKFKLTEKDRKYISDISIIIMRDYMQKKVVLIIISCISISISIGCTGSSSEEPTLAYPAECTMQLVPGITIQVFDASTEDPIACDAHVVLEDGDYMEEIDATVESYGDDDCVDDGTFEGAYERAGTYNITVTKEGYIDWHAQNIELTEDICHVNTRDFQVYMVKAN